MASWKKVEWSWLDPFSTREWPGAQRMTLSPLPPSFARARSTTRPHGWPLRELLPASEPYEPSPEVLELVFALFEMYRPGSLNVAKSKFTELLN